MQHAKAVVTVGLERAHAKLVSQREGLPVVDCGLLDLWGIAIHGDLANEPQGLCLVALLMMVAGVGQGALRQLTRFRHATHQQIRLTVTQDFVRPLWYVLQE
jgi:hypothetical protein